jgi:putative membrane protein
MTEYPVVNALIFAFVGVAAFAIAFSVVSRILPFDIKQEIVRERNIAAAIVTGALTLGLAWIIAATMH